MAEFNHTQGSSSATWTITHNFGLTVGDPVVVDVMVDDGPNSPEVDKIIVAIEQASGNALTVTFSEAHTGFARVVA